MENKQLYLFNSPSLIPMESFLKDSKKRISKNAMLNQLSEFIGNVAETCRAVGIARTTHYEWLKNDELYRNEFDKICNLVPVIIKKPKPKLNNLNKKQERKYQKDWARLVKLIGEHKCKRCGSTEKLNAHHIVQWKHNEKLRYSTDNGEVLCQSCHIKHHQLNGK